MSFLRRIESRQQEADAELERYRDVDSRSEELAKMITTILREQLLRDRMYSKMIAQSRSPEFIDAWRHIEQLFGGRSITISPQRDVKAQDVRNEILLRASLKKEKMSDDDIRSLVERIKKERLNLGLVYRTGTWDHPTIRPNSSFVEVTFRRKLHTLLDHIEVCVSAGGVEGGAYDDLNSALDRLADLVRSGKIFNTAPDLSNDY